MSSLFIRKILEHRLHVFTLLLTMTILFGLFVLGAQPFAVGLIPVPWDKVAHAGIFAVLAVCIGLACGWNGWRGWRLMLLIMGGTLMLGGLDEWHQYYLPGRHAQWEDLLADAVGGLIGAALLMRFGVQAERL